jgi:hypothetical protein
MPREFILPGDSPGEAAMAVGRTVVRRAERRVVALFESGEITNPDLQRKAVKYLGMSGDAASLKALEEIYAAASEVAVKQAVLEAFIVAEDHKRVLAAARAEKSPELRREAATPWARPPSCSSSMAPRRLRSYARRS